MALGRDRVQFRMIRKHRKRIIGYPAVVYQTCNVCGNRRVEQAICEHCGAEWDTVPTEGSEIVESDEVKKLVSVG